MLADDPGDVLLRVGGVIRRILSIRFIRLAKRQPNGGTHLAFLRAVRLVNQKSHAQRLQHRVVLDLVQHPGKLLLRGHDDRLALRHEARQIVCLAGQAHHLFQVGEVLQVFPHIGVQRLAVGQDEHHVHQLLAGAGLEQAVQPVCQPAHGERLAAACRMVDQVLAANVATRGKVL